MRPCGGGAHDHAQPLYTDVEQGPARPQPCRGWRGSPAHDIEAPAPALGPWGGPNGGAGAAAAVGGAATGCGPWAPRPETTWQGPLAPPSPRKPPAACCAPPAAGARPPAPPQPEPRWHGALSDAAATGRVLRRHPLAWVSALLVTLLLTAAGVAGVLSAAASQSLSEWQHAQASADTTALALQAELQQMLAPALALATFVRDDPDYPRLSARFAAVAQELLQAVPDSSSLVYLQAAPMGVVRSTYPPQYTITPPTNLLADPTRRGAALETIAAGKLTLQGPMMLKQGFVGVLARLPVFVDNVTNPHEDFGTGVDATNCSICYDAPARRRFWGFVSCVLKFESLVNGSHPKLAYLREHGLRYALYAPQPGGTTFVVAATTPPPPPPPDSVAAAIAAPNSEWQLYLRPEAGWAPAWRDPMAGAVAAAAALVGLLVGAVLVSRYEEAALAAHAEEARSVLDEERRSTGALQARQQCLLGRLLEGPGGCAPRACGEGACAPGAPEPALAPAPLARPPAAAGAGGEAAPAGLWIEGGPAAPADGNVHGGPCFDEIRGCADALQSSSEPSTSQELPSIAPAPSAAPGGAAAPEPAPEAAPAPPAAQAARAPRRCEAPPAPAPPAAGELWVGRKVRDSPAGRLYEGMWRGTPAAVEVIALPAGQAACACDARHAAAALDEAARRTEGHPNIVQVYACFAAPAAPRGADDSCSSSLSSSCGNSFASSLRTGAGAAAGAAERCGCGCAGAGGGPEAAEACPCHGTWEVTLVREWCDWGFLIDVLDGGAFYTADNALNYKAILETAADVARALAHLHARGAAHGRVRAAGVLLRSPGPGATGRGAVAKVPCVGLQAGGLPRSAGAGADADADTDAGPEAGSRHAASAAADVYAFGTLLWELYTGARQSSSGARPRFPPFTPRRYVQLAEACWAEAPEDRPTMAAALATLLDKRRQLGGATPTLTRAPHEAGPVSFQDWDARRHGVATAAPPSPRSPRSPPALPSPPPSPPQPQQQPQQPQPQQQPPQQQAPAPDRPAAPTPQPVPAAPALAPGQEPAPARAPAPRLPAAPLAAQLEGGGVALLHLVPLTDPCWAADCEPLCDALRGGRAGGSFREADGALGPLGACGPCSVALDAAAAAQLLRAPPAPGAGARPRRRRGGRRAGGSAGSFQATLEPIEDTGDEDTSDDSTPLASPPASGPLPYAHARGALEPPPRRAHSSGPLPRGAAAAPSPLSRGALGPAGAARRASWAGATEDPRAAAASAGGGGAAAAAAAAAEGAVERAGHGPRLASLGERAAFLFL